MVKLVNRHTALWLCLVLLAGCGGSSSSSSNSNPPPSGGDPAVITSGNAEVIAGAVANAALEGGVFDSFMGQGPLPSSSIDGGSALILSKLISAQQHARAILKGTSGTSALKIPLPETTVQCLVNGTITLSGEIADPLTFTPGDMFTMSFDVCDQGDGTILGGSFSMIVQSFAGDPAGGQFDLAMTITMSAFQVTEGGETVSASGDITFEVDTTQAPLTTVTVSANSMVVGTGGTTLTLSAFSTVVTEDESMSPVAVTIQVSGTLSSSGFTGDVSFSTTIVFQGSSDEYPSAGEMVITGADNATITMIALDSQNVRLEVDVDGDGAVDTTIDTTWDAIAA